MFKFIDLFAGIGGFRIAGENLNGKCVFSCEIDKTAQEVYYKNFKDVPYPDIRILNEKDIPDFDILFAGFPCQPFSISGLKLGFNDKKNGDLFFHIVRIIKHKKPKAFILENVKHFSRINKGEILKLAISFLKQLNYNIYYKVLNSKFFGVAQNRERLFIVGIHKDYKKSFYFPDGTNKKVYLENIIEKEVDESLFYRGDYKLDKQDIKNNIFRPYRLGFVRKGRQGERIYSIKGLSITISHSTGGIFSKTGGYLTPLGIRKLSINEVKKLFAFPLNYSFEAVNYNKAISLLGNSVVISVVEAVLRNILEVISKDKI